MVWTVPAWVRTKASLPWCFETLRFFWLPFPSRLFFFPVRRSWKRGKAVSTASFVLLNCWESSPCHWQHLEFCKCVPILIHAVQVDCICMTSNNTYLLETIMIITTVKWKPIIILKERKQKQNVLAQCVPGCLLYALIVWYSFWQHAVCCFGYKIKKKIPFRLLNSLL